MPVFEDFLRFHRVSACVPVPDESVRKYQGKLPPMLIEFWRENGWCGYGDGLTWFVNPDDYADLMREWFEDDPLPVVWGRTAFADLMVWEGNAVYKLFVHSGSYGRMMGSIRTYVDVMLTNNEALEDSHYVSLFKQARDKLGSLAADECYTFVPALAMGGRFHIDHVQKVKVREQFHFLSQVHGKIKR